MRSLFTVFLSIFIISNLYAQNKNRFLELNFSLIHPELHRDNYRYSIDPSGEILYCLALSDKLTISSGLQVQTGQHNWKEFTGHTIIGEDGIPVRIRTNYSRHFDYFCAGIPLKLEKNFNSSIITSLFVEFTGGRYFKAELADYFESEQVESIEVENNLFFWDVQFGINQTLHHSGKINVGFSPIIGIRNQGSNFHNLAKYFYYGIGISTKIPI